MHVLLNSSFIQYCNSNIAKVVVASFLISLVCSVLVLGFFSVHIAPCTLYSYCSFKSLSLLKAIAIGGRAITIERAIRKRSKEIIQQEKFNITIAKLEKLKIG